MIIIVEETSTASGGRSQAKISLLSTGALVCSCITDGGDSSCIILLIIHNRDFAIQYAFYPLMDACGNNINTTTGSDKTEAEQQCSSDTICTAFNTQGEIKYGVSADSLAQDATFNPPCNGTYIKTGGYSFRVGLGLGFDTQKFKSMPCTQKACACHPPHKTSQQGSFVLGED